MTPRRPIGFPRLLRIRTLAQFVSADAQRLTASVRSDAARRKANCRRSEALINFVLLTRGSGLLFLLPILKADPSKDYWLLSWLH
jgi:hypothetical protein